MRLFRKEWGIRIGIVLTYLLMWKITYYAESGMINHFWGDGEVKSLFTVMGNNLGILVLGIILFAVPYEFVWTWMVYEVAETCYLFKPNWIKIKGINKQYVELTMLALLYFALIPVVWMHKEFISPWNNNNIGVIDCVRSFVGLLLMLKLYGQIKKPIYKLIFSEILPITLNTAICFLLTDKFITSVIMAFLFMAVWHIYDFITEKRLSVKSLFTEIAILCCLFALFIMATGHYMNWLSFLNPYEFKNNDSSQVMTLIRDGKAWGVDIEDSLFYFEHPFITIYHFIGLPALVAHLIIFIMSALLAVWQIVCESRKSKIRASLFAAVYLLFASIYVYRLMTDIGIMPEGTMPFLQIKYAIPIIAIMLRVLLHGRECTLNEMNLSYEDSDEDLDDEEEILLDTYLSVKKMAITLSLQEARLTKIEKHLGIDKE